jgi:hypothetical protein
MHAQSGIIMNRGVAAEAAGGGGGPVSTGSHLQEGASSTGSHLQA